MTSLEKYLTEEYPSDKREIEDIDQLLTAIANVYRADFDPEVTGWPYVYPTPKGDPGASLSLSTTAMILNSLLRLGDHFKGSDLSRKRNGIAGLVFPLKNADEIFDEKLCLNIKSAAQLILKRVEDNANETPVALFLGDADSSAKPRTVLTDSGTYGPNDVFTVTWIGDICAADWSTVDSDFATNSVDLRRNINELIAAKLEAITRLDSDAAARVLFDPQLVGNKSKPAPHAFPVLRLIQAVKRLKLDDSKFASFYYKFFERILHEQLSFSSIPDSRFDPAELAFCLEGMLLCRRKTVDRTIFDRVLAVLTAAQHQSPYWRPVKPFLTTKQGLVLFPVSVEIANSLLRSCAIFDGNQLHDTYSSKCIGLFRRYAQWLRARAVRLSGDGAEFVGWHSEHVNEADMIHLWETSQVLEFLISYRNALHLHISRTTLVLSRFKQTNFESDLFSVVADEKSEGKEKVDETAGVKENLTDRSVEDDGDEKDGDKLVDWTSLKNKYEPVSELGPKLAVYNNIGIKFVEPLTTKEGRPNFSMLLYGPPGTGKTTIAENIATALHRRMITITVSDFLAAGGAQVEARAKDIFTVLMSQPECVIFFDEIDHFLLDRDSTRYNDQETVYQFMTPGMLTKLNDLRRAQNSIFVVATNYEDRIDAAIKRVGRIDERYLVLPPDQKKREAIIRARLKKKSKTLSVNDGDVTELAKAALFLGFVDIKAVIGSAPIKESDWVTRTKKDFADRAKTISLEAYASRFRARDGKPLNVGETPIKEFLCLMALKAELGDSAEFDDAEKAVLRSAADVLGLTDLTWKGWRQAILKHAAELEINVDDTAMALERATPPPQPKSAN